MKAHDFVNEVGFIITNLKDIDEDIMLYVKFGDKMDKERYDTKMPAVLNCLYAIKKMLEMEPTMRIPKEEITALRKFIIDETSTMFRTDFKTGGILADSIIHRLKVETWKDFS